MVQAQLTESENTSSMKNSDSKNVKIAEKQEGSSSGGMGKKEDETKKQEVPASAKSDITEKHSSNNLKNVNDLEVKEIIAWLDRANQNPKQLRELLDKLETQIDLIDDVLKQQKKSTQRIPGIDKRVESLELYESAAETSDMLLAELNKIKLQTELTNLREKKLLVWENFVKVCGSEKKALNYKRLKANAQSRNYHNKASYSIKQRIRKILNTIIEKDRSALVELKSFASNFSEGGVKTFNDRMKELLFVYDEDLVVLCSYVKKELYYMLMQLTISKWEPDTEAEIAELSAPAEQE